MNGILHASVFLAQHSLEKMERMGAECLALSRRLGDNSALNYAYWNVALNYAFRGLMQEAREPRSTLLSPRCTSSLLKNPRHGESVVIQFSVTNRRRLACGAHL